MFRPDDRWRREGGGGTFSTAFFSRLLFFCPDFFICFFLVRIAGSQVHMDMEFRQEPGDGLEKDEGNVLMNHVNASTRDARSARCAAIHCTPRLLLFLRAGLTRQPCCIQARNEVASGADWRKSDAGGTLWLELSTSHSRWARVVRYRTALAATPLSASD